jgi:hypothetical protein
MALFFSVVGDVLVRFQVLFYYYDFKCLYLLKLNFLISSFSTVCLLTVVCGHTSNRLKQNGT